MAIRAVVFDYGGTLIDEGADVPDLERRGAERLARWLVLNRLPIRPDHFVARFLELRAEHVRRSQAERRQTTVETTLLETLHDLRIANRRGRSEAVDRWVRKATRQFLTHAVERSRTFEGTLAMLVQLRSAGLRLAVLSNASSDWLIRTVLEREGLSPLLDGIFTSAMLVRRKPDAEVFRAVAQALGVEPEECVFVGDSYENDVEGSRNIGMRCLWARWGRDDEGQLGEPPSAADAVAFEIAGTVPTILGWL